MEQSKKFLLPFICRISPILVQLALDEDFILVTKGMIQVLQSIGDLDSIREGGSREGQLVVFRRAG